MKAYVVDTHQDPVVQSIVSLTSSLRVVSLKLLTFFSKIFQHICISLNVNFNESLTDNIVSFEQLGPEVPHRGTSN